MVILALVLAFAVVSAYAVQEFDDVDINDVDIWDENGADMVAVIVVEGYVVTGIAVAMLHDCVVGGVSEMVDGIVGGVSTAVVNPEILIWTEEGMPRLTMMQPLHCTLIKVILLIFLCLFCF